jgi:nitroreductase
METFHAIRTMLAVRKYRDTPIPDDVVRRVVEAGRLTGSSRNLQPWHFVVVRNRETLKTIGTMAVSGPYIAQAPLAIAVAHETESVYGVSDASRAVQSMMLAAWEDGIGSNWVGFNNLVKPAELLGIPASHSLMAILSFGYPVDKIGRGKKLRKPLGKIASTERFGTPFGE